MNDEPKTIKSIIDLLYLPAESKLIPESDHTGNIEYKLRLDKKGTEKRDNMVAQMLFRLNEGRNKYGRYEAHYIIGVHDNGTFSDISEQTLALSVNILRGVAKQANSKIVSEKTYVFPGNKLMTHVVIRKDHKERNILESNVMIMGPSEVGKSSLMGKLTYGQKDDGNGFSRKLVLRHMHEKTSGNTSCLKYDTIGFAGENIINYGLGIDFTMENIYTASDRLISLIDIPGDIVAFTKTILYSVLSINPDHIIICIPCKVQSISPEQFIKKHIDIYKFILAVCIVYKIQPIIVLTKQDLLIPGKNQCSDSDIGIKICQLFNMWRDELMNRLEESKDLRIQESNDVQTCFDDDDTLSEQSEEHDSSSTHFDNKLLDFTTSPCIKVSNITDYGYDELIALLSKISKNKTLCPKHSDTIRDRLFVVNDVFTIPDTGTIFHGTLRYGVINVDDIVNVMCHGIVSKHKVKSIHRKTLDVDRLLSGESGSITFEGKSDKIDKTAIIIDPSWETEMVVKTNIVSAFDSVTLKPQQYTMFVGNNIVTVYVTQSPESDLIFEANSYNDVRFVIDTEIGILKDERQNYFFVRFV